MTTVTLDASGDYTTLDAAIVYLNSVMANPPDSITLNVTPGTWTATTTALYIDPGTDRNWGGKTVTIQKDPLATGLVRLKLKPNGDGSLARIYHSGALSNGTIIIKDVYLETQDNTPGRVLEDDMGSISLELINVLMFINSTNNAYVLTYIASPAHVYLKNCSIFLSRYSSGANNNLTINQGSVSDVSLYNCLVCFNSSEIAAPVVQLGQSHAVNSVQKNNVVYNYSGSQLASINNDYGTWSQTGTINDQDPLLSGGTIIATANDTSATMFARSCELAGAAGPCYNNADTVSATTTDILGNSRA